MQERIKEYIEVALNVHKYYVSGAFMDGFSLPRYDVKNDNDKD